ncbi:MAG: pirin-like C-terminal cupin domain-containing protein [Bacillota bacterium]
MIKSKNAVLFEEGDTLLASASKSNMRFLVFSAKPLKESIAWGGPIVMNTQEELFQARQDIENKTFVKKPEQNL